MTTQTQPTYYDLYDADATFLLRAPLPVIAQILQLAKSARERIAREAEWPGGVCKLHLNGKYNPVGSGAFLMIQEAVGPRANY